MSVATIVLEYVEAQKAVFTTLKRVHRIGRILSLFDTCIDRCDLIFAIQPQQLPKN